MGLRLMTEADWLECVSPEVMLAYLGTRATPRKRRLFACACVRRIWPLLADERLRQAVKIAERFADGQASTKLLAKARRVTRRIRDECEASVEQKATLPALTARAAAQAVEALLAESGPLLVRPRDIREPPDVITASRTARAAARAAEAERGDDAPAVAEPIRRLHSLDAVDLIRELFGNPFRPATLDPSWRRWKDGIVPKMARVIYRKRCFRNLPILADVLEEAGCRDEVILGHCRAPLEHVRGCWLVDAVLGQA